MREGRSLAGLLWWISACGVLAQDPGYIDLGDVTAGGNGLGTADPSAVGIHPDTGALVSQRFRSYIINEGENPQPVDGSGASHDSPFIDAVFVIHAHQMEITSTGIVFAFDEADSNRRAWGAILNGWDTNGPKYLEFGPGVIFEEGVAVHAPEGITYDLEALRLEHGNGMVRYVSAVAGENSSPEGPGSASTYMILSSATDVLAVARFPDASNLGKFQELQIPEDARFLTLAVGAANSDIVHDHGAFGRARITAEPTATVIDHLRVRGGAVVLEPGAEKQLEVQAILGGELGGVLADSDLSPLTFESLDPSVARASESGLITGVAAGSTEILIRMGDLDATAPVFVGRVLDLGDLVAGGDGTGTAPPEHIGIDPRTGDFAIEGAEILSEADPEGDGLDPSPVSASELLDSVFILRAADPEAGPLTTQQITQSGISFDFPAKDGLGTTRNHILKDANGGEPGPIEVGRDIGFRSAVGIHSSAGFTIDLQAVRDAHGPDAAGSFLTYWGVDYCRSANVNLYAIVSDADGVIDSVSSNLRDLAGEQVAVAIPAEAMYLTLVAGSNGSDRCDHGTFANAVLLASPSTPFVRGDCNGDAAAIDISDAVFLLISSFAGGPEPPCRAACDANGDGDLGGTSDAVFLLAMLFQSGPPPPPPFPLCGPGPIDTDRVLGCVDSPGVCR